MKHTSAQLKQMARANLSNKWGIAVGLTALQTLITYAITECTSFFQSTSTLGITVYLIATLIVTLLTSLFTIGSYHFYLNICRGREYRIGDLFSAFKMNPDRFLIVGLILNIPIILIQLPSMGPVGAYTLSDGLHIIMENMGYSIAIATVSTIFSMFFGLAYFLMLDFPEMGALTSMRLSATLMRGNMLRYVYMFTVSFIGWKFLATLSLNIGYLWITPYITMTMTYFYCDVLEQLKHSPYMQDYDVPDFFIPEENDFVSYHSEETGSASFKTNENNFVSFKADENSSASSKADENSSSTNINTFDTDETNE